jgi:hypothetical protein
MAFGLDTLGDIAKDLSGKLHGNLSGSADSLYTTEEAAAVFTSPDHTPWTINGIDWYKVFAYQFVVKTYPAERSKNRSSALAALGGSLGVTVAQRPSGEIIYALPIPPQSLSVRMISASQATPTVGGVVEETGANVFWLINMSGTTGVAVSRASDGGIKRSEVAQQFRDKITTTGLMSGPLAGINSAISKIGGIADSLMGAGKAALSGNFAGAIGGVVGAANTALLPPLPYSGSGVSKDTNGYTEMMEFHRFLYTYSKLKSSNPPGYSLAFRNFKTNQEWDCIVQDFQIQQSAQSPMLYKYNIVLKCWGIRPPGGDRSKAEYDRFGPNGDLNAVNTVDPFQMAKLGKKMISKLTPLKWK